MADLPRREWREMTTAEIAGADTARWIAVLPVAGAAPDAGILEHALTLLPDGLPVTLLPAPGPGPSGGRSAPAGTLALSPETAGRMWTEIGESVHRAGVRKLVLFGGGDGAAATAERVARDLAHRLGMLAVAWDPSGPGGPDEAGPGEGLARLLGEVDGMDADGPGAGDRG